eukprot:CAMPEP_0167746540 /NCGR_PEP_ID=MMETSP0110_2-20121227/3768_1 /TAXON_ID=629695 /ORGANISM="Gymnochlora sp., Strain CCMP2014" /LENGTH=633 /DNA_ID=CAMNT_0007631313 /DNA_START=1 /DNA_END=1902 /DNA_ORIENTATION=+
MCIGMSQIKPNPHVLQRTSTISPKSFPKGIKSHFSRRHGTAFNKEWPSKVFKCKTRIPKRNEGTQVRSVSGLAAVTPRADSSISVESIVKSIREQASVIAPGSALQLAGKARWLGMDSRWEQVYSSDGSVRVSINNKDVSVAWGYDATSGPNGEIWEQDFNGLVSKLELDEREVRLLMVWMPNSFWTTPEIQASLDISLAEKGTIPDEWKFWNHANPPWPEYSVPDGDDVVTLSIGLKGGRIKAMATYLKDTWELVSLSLPSSGVLKHMRYDGWFEIGDSIVYPREVQDTDEGGMTNVFTTGAGRLLTGDGVPPPQYYECPKIPLLPKDTTFDTSVSSKIKAFRARSNHILVQPIIDGVRHNVSMMLDTGASGLCISREFADQINLPKFGEVVIQGATQVITSQFRRAKSLSLGPITIEDPVFMELSLRGIVRASRWPVVGILGYDAYRRMVLEMPVMGGSPWNDTDFEITMHNPNTFKGEALAPESDWLEITMQGRTPLAKTNVEFEDETSTDIQLMLDSGAGGMNIVFHERAKEQLRLNERATLQRASSITGISSQNGTAGSLGVSSINLQSLKLSDHASFNNISAYVPERGGLDISMYMAGILCNDLLLQCKTVYDYPHNRILLIKEEMG